VHEVECRSRLWTRCLHHPPDNVADVHIPIVFPPSLVPHAYKWFHQEERIPFFNGQLRSLAAETVRLQVVDPLPEIPENGPESDQFGELMRV